MASRIEQIIEDIEEYIDGCKHQALSPSNIIVNKEAMEDLLVQLRTKTPEEIKRYQKIISNKEAILADAQAKADEIIARAQIRTDELVSEHQIMQQAYAQANEVVKIASQQAQEILDSATNDANDIRMGAMQYTDDILRNVENTLSHALETNKARFDSYQSSMQTFLDTVVTNRAEINPDVDMDSQESDSHEKNGQDANEEPDLPPIEINTDFLDQTK